MSGENKLQDKIRSFLAAEYEWWEQTHSRARLGEAFLLDRGDWGDKEDMEYSYVAQHVYRYLSQLVNAFRETPTQDGPALVKACPPPAECRETKRRIEQIVELLMQFRR